MPALPTDIVRATRDAQVVSREDDAVKAIFPAARDSLKTPQPGYFVNATDAQTVLGLTAALIGKARQRFAVGISGEFEVDPLSGIPTYHLIDEETGANLPVMLCRVEVDDELETSTIEVLG